MKKRCYVAIDIDDGEHIMTFTCEDAFVESEAARRCLLDQGIRLKAVELEEHTTFDQVLAAMGAEQDL